MKTQDKARQLAQLLRSATPRRVRRGIARIGDYAAADMRESLSYPSIELALKTLRGLGFEPRFCVDVGAYHGSWTRSFRSVFPLAEVLMVEPQQGKRETLERVALELAPGVHCETALLGAVERQPVIFYEMETGSSVFEEQSSYPRVAVKTTTRTLDSILAERSYPPVDFIKVDVQGAELEVLKGGSRAMEQASAILAEVSLVPVNAGCPSFADVIGFLADKDFQLFDFCSQVRRKDGVLWQTDLLFLRSGSAILPKPELTSDNWG